MSIDSIEIFYDGEFIKDLDLSSYLSKLYHN